MQVPESYANLIERLGGSDRLEAVPSPPVSLHKPSSNPAFVPPPLLRDGIADATCPLALVSAPGAMGKTTLAHELAADTGAWVWDLGTLRLGSNSFIGTIGKTFGPANLSNILEGFREGRIIFLFDAFDEAEILSGLDNVESFVREIWEYARHSRAICAVLFARGETGKLLEFLLEDITDGASAGSTWEIDFFGEPEAADFVGRQVERLRSGGLTPAYENLCQELFSLVRQRITGDATAAWDEPAVRSFLGYAPVLQTMASLLAEISNPSAVDLSEELSGGEENVLDGLLFALLRREQKKVTDRLGNRFPDRAPGFEGLDRLYAPTEQFHRLLTYLAGDRPPANLTDVTVPDWLQEVYDETLRAFLPQHPFIREGEFAGPAFRDYVLAFNLRREAFAPLAETFLDGGGFVPTPLLMDFYRRAGRPGTIGPGRHAAYLYESATSRASGRLETQTVLMSPGGEEGHLLEVRTEGDDRQPEHEARVHLHVAAGVPVHFRRRLNSALINIEGPLVLGPAGGEMELSDVSIQCRQLTVAARTVRVRVPRSDDEVILRAGDYREPSGTLAVEVKGQGNLSVDWPGAENYPWTKYHRREAEPEKYDREAAAAALYRLLRWMRRDGREQFAKFTEMIDNVVVAGQEIRQDMLAFLLEKGVLREVGEMYVLDAEISGRVGINWSHLRQGRVSDRLGTFLDEFMGRRST